MNSVTTTITKSLTPYPRSRQRSNLIHYSYYFELTYHKGMEKSIYRIKIE